MPINAAIHRSKDTYCAFERVRPAKRLQKSSWIAHDLVHMTSDLARFTLRWAVDSSAWAPGDPEWQFLLGLLPLEDSQAVGRFKFKDDQKRALLSRSVSIESGEHPGSRNRPAGNSQSLPIDSVAIVRKVLLHLADCCSGRP